MSPANLFQLEVKAVLVSRRALAVRVGVTLLLGFPFALLDLPGRAGPAGLGMLVLFAGLFGSLVALVRRRGEGREERLRLWPLPRWAVALDTALAGAAVDLVQLAPVLGLFLAVHGRPLGIGHALELAGLLVGTLAFLNGLGLALASLVRSNAEAHLFGALAVGGTALLSGLLPVPARLAPGVAAVASWSPAGRLVSGLRDAVDGAGSGSPAAALTLVLFLVLCLARAADRPRLGPS